MRLARIEAKFVARGQHRDARAGERESRRSRAGGERGRRRQFAAAANDQTSPAAIVLAARRMCATGAAQET